MSGNEPEKWSDAAMNDVYIENIAFAAQRLAKVSLYHLPFTL